MRVSLLVTLAVAATSLMACTSTYHPEYHPVTATNITQSYQSTGGGQVVSPASPGGPVIVQQPPAANPDDFFNTSQR